MSTAKKIDYEHVLNVVRTWPPDRRLTLVQDVLKTLAPVVADERRQRPTLDRALGLLVTNRPTPTDAEIAQWLDERRTNRYGQ